MSTKKALKKLSLKSLNYFLLKNTFCLFEELHKNTLHMNT